MKAQGKKKKAVPKAWRERRFGCGLEVIKKHIKKPHEEAVLESVWICRCSGESPEDAEVPSPDAGEGKWASNH